jgi:Ca2+-transporting ATPase
MPVRFFEKFFKAIRLMSEPEVLPTVQPDKDKDGWPGAIDRVRDNLSTFANIRGGRLRSSSFVIKSRSQRLSQDNTIDSVSFFFCSSSCIDAYWVFFRSSILAMGPTLIIGAVAAGEGLLNPWFAVRSCAPRSIQIICRTFPGESPHPP